MLSFYKNKQRKASIFSEKGNNVQIEAGFLDNEGGIILGSSVLLNLGQRRGNYFQPQGYIGLNNTNGIIECLRSQIFSRHQILNQKGRIQTRSRPSPYFDICVY